MVLLLPSRGGLKLLSLVVWFLSYPESVQSFGKVPLGDACEDLVKDKLISITSNQTIYDIRYIFSPIANNA